jgi:hypothetical protein
MNRGLLATAASRNLVCTHPARDHSWPRDRLDGIQKAKVALLLLTGSSM